MTSSVKTKRTVKCSVISDKMEKSRVGSVVSLVKHPRYKKYIKRTVNFMFHDEKEVSKVGDRVLISEGKHISKRKKYILLDVLKG